MAKKKKTEKDFPWSLIGSALLTFIAGVILMYLYGEDLLPKTLPSSLQKTRTVKIYYSDKTGKSITAERHIIDKGTLKEQLELTLEALIKGPDDKELTGTIPAGTKLLGVKVKGDIAFINLSGELMSAHGGGSSGELQTIYSIVNSATVSFNSINFVQILIDGNVVDTIAGHILVNIPLQQNSSLVTGN